MLLSHTALFDRYAERALEGQNGWIRFVGGIILALAIWAVVTVVSIVAGMAVLLVGSRAGGDPFDFSDPTSLMERFAQTNVGMAFLLLSLGGLWIGVWAALRLFHKRKLASVLAAGGRLDRGDFARAFAVFAALPFLLQLFSLMTEPDVVRNPLPFSSWLLLALGLAVVLVLQTSAEEVFFRGYLPQTLASKARSPLVWALLPALAFAILHWRGGVSTEMNIAMFGGILVFALALVALVARTGSLAASMGAHYGNNLMAILFVSHDEMFARAAFFNGAPLQDAGGGVVAATQFLATAGMVAAGYFALVHPRSPLALTAARVHTG